MWLFNRMKTATIELPDSVFERLVSAAHREHQALPAYLTHLLAGHAAASPQFRAEPSLPLIPSQRPGSVNLTNQRIAELESTDDAQRYGRTAGR